MKRFRTLARHWLLVLCGCRGVMRRPKRQPSALLPHGFKLLPLANGRHALVLPCGEVLFRPHGVTVAEAKMYVRMQEPVVGK